MKQIFFSVIVTTKNEEKNIEKCLLSIKNQNYKNFEIIVVDNYSEDRTEEISKKYTEKFYKVGPERSAQRNYGMATKADGLYVMYIDADMILAPTLLDEASKYLGKCKHVSGLYISERILGNGYWSRIRNFERSFYDGTAIDACRIYKRLDFLSVGGFDEELFKAGSGEDWDLDKSIKKRGALETLPYKKMKDGNQSWLLEEFIASNFDQYISGENCIYHNESEFNIIKYIKKKYYYTAAFDAYIEKWGSGDVDIKRQLGAKYRLFCVFIENGKWVRLVRRPQYAVGMYFLRFLVGFAYIVRLTGEKFSKKNINSKPVL